MANMLIEVTESIDGLHSWPEAPDNREYLKFSHRHKFVVTVWAEVTHTNRDLEFHDLKDELREHLQILGDKWGIGDLRDFGRSSCEDIGQGILKHIPSVSRVRVMEDDECGAILTRAEVAPKKALKVVTICGSTRFKEEHLAAMQLLEDLGIAVFMVGCFMHADSVPVTPAMKIAYDTLHKQKILMSDGIFVVSRGGYVGDSTRGEIEHARSLRKEIWFSEPNGVVRAKEIQSREELATWAKS